ncbi:MAG: hypothetical protein ACI4IX_06570 [Acutalibacteraceae bacterium]
MNCKKCNSPLIDGAKFCSVCGTSQAPDEPKETASFNLGNASLTQNQNEAPSIQTPPVQAPQQYLPQKKPGTPFYTKWQLWAAVVAILLVAIIVILFVGRKEKDNDYVPKGETSSTNVSEEFETEPTGNDSMSVYYNESNYTTTKKPESSDVKAVNLGETITDNGLLEISFEEASWADSVLPSGYKEGLYPPYELQDVSGQKYLVIKGKIKNVSSQDVNIDNIYLEAVFDEKYTFQSDCGLYVEDTEHTDFESFYVTISPLSERICYFVCQVSDELYKSAQSCDFYFGFDNEMSDNPRYYGLKACDYSYVVKLSMSRP